MSVTVRTHEGQASQPRATRWDVTEHGGLLLIDTDRTVAEYAPGAWIAVELDLTQVDDVAPDGDAVFEHFALGFEPSGMLPPVGSEVRLFGLPFTVTSSLRNRETDVLYLGLKGDPR